MKNPILASTCLVAVLAASAMCPANASGKPPFSVDQTMPMVAESKISAAIEFSIAALDRALERRVPKRLATFRDRTTSCWHRRVLGRYVNIDCEYSGYVERTGPVSLRAEGGRLRAATPVFGMVSAQGARGLASLVHGTAEGRMTVDASARPRLRPDWSVALDIGEGFRWTEAPALNVLGFRIDLTRFVEPRIRSQLARVQRDALASARALDIRGKAETAWQRAFDTVQIAETPPVFLRTSPQQVAFAGMHARGDVLEGSIEISGTTETFVGAAPAAATPTPLPRLRDDVTEPGKFALVVPVTIGYDAIRLQVEAVMASHAAEDGPVLRDVEIYPSNGKVVVGLRVSASQQGTDAGEWAYLTATPQLDADNALVQFPDLALSDSSLSAPLTAWLASSDALRTLQQQLRLGYQAELDKVVTSANAQLTRDLGRGFRSEAQLASAGIGGISLMAGGLQINLRAAGRLRIFYGL
jgi:uncharacterized protein DUF4403